MMLEFLFLLLGLLRAGLGDRAALVADNLVLRHQLAVLTRPTRTRPRLQTRDRLLWLLVRCCWSDWRRHLVVVRPETVVRWHRQAWKLLWRWKSRVRVGRPRLSAEVQELIATMARETPAWGSERIRGELLKLGIAVSKRSIQRYRRRGPARPPSQTWRTFLTNHAGQIWAADLLSVQTLACKTLYVLLFITHHRRELLHLNVTAHPTAAWVWRQLIEATPWGRTPRMRTIAERVPRKGGGVDQQQRREIEAQLDKLGRDAQKIAENAKSALDHLRQGDFQMACDIVALSHYPIGHVKADHDALMEAFTAAGIEPGAGR